MSQSELILRALQNGEEITPIDGLNRFNCFRLGARILELRKLGYPILTEWEHKGNKKWAKYKLARETLFD